MDEKTVPPVRFDGFTNAWEQRKASHAVPTVRFRADDGSDFPDWEKRTVGDLFTFVAEKNVSNEIDNVITNSAEYGLIPQRDFFDKDIAVEGKTENYTIIHKGDFVYNPRKSTTAPFGPFNMYRREEPGIVSPLYTCLTPRRAGTASYLSWYFQTDRWFSYIVKNGAQGGARHDRVGMTVELMKGIPVFIPSALEQQSIATLLSSVDSTIALCRRKLDLLTQAKKALMQQIFSQKLRFKADDGSDFPDWEKKKLGDLFKISAGGDLKKNQSSPVKSQEFSYPVYANALVNKGFHSFANYYVITGESFTVTGRGDVGFAVPRHEQYVPIVRLLVCQPLHGENVDFFAALINQIHILVESTGVPQLTVPQLSSLVVSVPSLPEQQKIASCLSSADALIDQARVGLEQWQEVKKSLLQQMFV